MKRRARVETYWAIWELRGDTWHPCSEGATTRWAAAREMRVLQRLYPEDRYCLVRTRHERVTS